MLDFRSEVADTLCKMGSFETPKRGRLSSSSPELELHIAKKRKGPPTYIPSKDVRMDNTGQYGTKGTGVKCCRLFWLFSDQM